jgi:hypothetical protein
MDGLLNTLNFFHKMFADTHVKFVVVVQNWFLRCEGCSIIEFYNGS